MFGKKIEPLAEKKEKILESYNKIADKFVYRTVESLQEAKVLEKEEVSILQQAGFTVVMLVGGKQITHLGPGQDPYRARKVIDNFFKAQERESESKKKTHTFGISKTAAKKTTAKIPSGVLVEKTSI